MMNQNIDVDTLQLLRYLMQTARLTEVRLDDLLSDVSLSATRWLTLRQIEMSDDSLSLSQLASCLSFVKSNATQVIDNLEKTGLVQRMPDPEDRRCTLLQVTAEGQQRHKAAQQAVQPFVDQLNTLYSPEERAQLLSLLQRMHALR